MKNTFRATVPALNFLFFFSTDGTTAAAAYFLETIWKQDLMDEVSDALKQFTPGSSHSLGNFESSHYLLSRGSNRRFFVQII